MNNQTTPAPMTAEEFLNQKLLSISIIFLRKEREVIIPLMDDYANYRFLFERDHKQQTAISGMLVAYQKWCYEHPEYDLITETAKVKIYLKTTMYANYHLKEQQQPPADPYYTDPATWPEWANWTAVDEDGQMWFYEFEPQTDDEYNDWWVEYNRCQYDFSGYVKNNPDWRNSKRSRKEVRK